MWPRQISQNHNSWGLPRDLQTKSEPTGNVKCLRENLQKPSSALVVAGVDGLSTNIPALTAFFDSLSQTTFLAYIVQNNEIVMQAGGIEFGRHEKGFRLPGTPTQFDTLDEFVCWTNLG